MQQKVLPSEGLPWRFTDKRFTAWGGLRVLEEALRRLGWPEALSKAPLPQPGSNRGLCPKGVVQSFLVTIWVGGLHFTQTALVRYDEALRSIFHLEEVGCVATFTRFFRRFKQSEVEEVFKYLSGWCWERLTAHSWTIDLDSSVITRYGHQEGSQRGYNPRRRGKRSHHPLMAFAAECRMVVSAWLRPGNTTDGSNVENFFQEVLNVLGSRHRVGLLRADSGFCIGSFLDLLEEKKIDYIVVARLMGVLRRQIAGLKSWVPLDERTAAAECLYQAQGWSRPRRIVVLRFPARERPTGQLLFHMPGYTYAIYVTNLRLSAVHVRQLYLGRADSENRIKELLQDFAISGFVSQKFWATEAAFRMALCAYNLMSLFRQLTLGTASKHTLSTLRFQCFAIGASLGRAGRKQLLRLGIPPARRAWFEGLFSVASALSPYSQVNST
jgi:Transposase DDE domain group 1